MNHATTGTLRKKIIIGGVAVAMLLFVFLQMSKSDDVAEQSHSTAPSQSQPSAPPTPAKTFSKNAHSTTEANSLWVIVNKQHALNPKEYTPTLTVPGVPLKGGSSASNMHVSTQMAPALVSLFNAAKASGHTLMLSSGYRSYSYQVSVYGRIVASQGQDKADTQSARPGFSEHQTGLAADIAPRSGKCDLSQCFGATPEGKWVAANAYKYGFIIRYPSDKVAVTGYEYEPWHIRYVGVDLATQMHQKNIETLEEFFDVSGGTSYN